MGNYIINRLIFDIQAYFVRDVISGKHPLPDLTHRHQDDLNRDQ